MLLLWVLAIGLIIAIFLVISGVLATLALNSTGGSNSTISRNYAWWSGGVAALGAVISIVLLVVYGAVATGDRMFGIFMIGVIGIILLLGVAALSFLAVRGTTTTDYSLWASIVAFVGAVIIIGLMLFYVYYSRFLIGQEIYLGLASGAERVRLATEVRPRNIPPYNPPGYVLTKSGVPPLPSRPPPALRTSSFSVPPSPRLSATQIPSTGLPQTRVPTTSPGLVTTQTNTAQGTITTAVPTPSLSAGKKVTFNLPSQ